VREADPEQPISRLRTIEEALSTSMAQRRFNTWIVALFAGTALLLAAIGTYGVMAFAVAIRSRLWSSQACSAWSRCRRRSFPRDAR
jgi:hypothetical protein